MTPTQLRATLAGLAMWAASLAVLAVWSPGRLPYLAGWVAGAGAGAVVCRIRRAQTATTPTEERRP